jgi:hypothetical protein
MNKSKKTITVASSIEPLPDINPHPGLPAMFAD